MFAQIDHTHLYHWLRSYATQVNVKITILTSIYCLSYDVSQIDTGFHIFGRYVSKTHFVKWRFYASSCFEARYHIVWLVTF